MARPGEGVGKMGDGWGWHECRKEAFWAWSWGAREKAGALSQVACLLPEACGDGEVVQEPGMEPSLQSGQVAGVGAIGCGQQQRGQHRGAFRCLCEV